MGDKKLFLEKYFELWGEENPRETPSKNIRFMALRYYRELQGKYLKFLANKIPLSDKEIAGYKPTFFKKYPFWTKYESDCPLAVEYHISNILRKSRAKISEIKWVLAQIKNEILEPATPF